VSAEDESTEHTPAPRKRRRRRGRRGTGRTPSAGTALPGAVSAAAHPSPATQAARPAIQAARPAAQAARPAAQAPSPVAPQDQRARLRAGILAFLDRHPETQAESVLDALHQTLPRFERAEEITALEVLHELVTANLLMPGLDRAHLGWPWLRLTEYGRKVIRHGKPLPFDPDEYLAAAQQRLPSLSPLALEVLRESVATFHRGFVRSSALLLGTASEILMMELIDAFIAGRPEKDQQRLQAVIEDKSIYARYRIFREEFEKARVVLKIPDPVSKDIDTIIDLVFNAIRLNRNEAGHPSADPLNATLVATTLQAFIEYAERLAGLSAFLKEPAEGQPAAAPRRRRSRRRRSA